MPKDVMHIFAGNAEIYYLQRVYGYSLLKSILSLSLNVLVSFSTELKCLLFRSSDSGVYKCCPSNAPTTNVTVHVLTGKWQNAFTPRI